ncbi:MAG: prolipoprotein diacylglyceryl transferase [Chlamydiota bacterium]|nr:prolipoprotein diacylglyceryl transferase [Chlamydiota bacterium]
MIFSWLYWNPNRFIFTFPYLDRPIAWYGFFFVIGFVIGYFMMIRMLTTSLRHSQYVTDRDIINWKELIKGLHTTNFATFLSSKAKKIQENDQLSSKEKNLLIESLNDTLSDPNTPYTRENINEHLPSAISSLRDLATSLTDRLTWYIIAGTLIGSRLGHVFLYDWPRYKNNPIDIIKIWEGGLASHGGTVGVFIALYLYWRHIRRDYPEIPFLSLLDKVCVPTALVAFFIRIGNFINQEILGTKTTVPWAIIFGNPADGSGVYPRHPVQLYEAFAYLGTFFIMLWLWSKKREELKHGFITGLFFVLIFTSRFFLEYFKMPQGMMIDESMIQTGQLLSIPFIIFGIWLMARKEKI